MSRLVLETAIGPVLALLLGKLRAARWDSAGATAEGTQDPAPDRAAGQGLATTHWRASAQRNSGEPGLTLAAARILGRPADSAGHPEAIEAEPPAGKPSLRETPAAVQPQPTGGSSGHRPSRVAQFSMSPRSQCSKPMRARPREA